ncbi:MAG TPA: MmgE/PrpD family protein, partial [Gammaproteobacteria bacterium]|nr:MmgE/PrpD family protein [Gammaproteobacteria bacterium]
MTIDAIEHIAHHVVETGFDDLPQEAVAASQKFILDSIGVGLAGSGGPWVTELINAMGAAPAQDSARVWG